MRKPLKPGRIGIPTLQSERRNHDSARRLAFLIAFRFGKGQPNCWTEAQTGFKTVERSHCFPFRKDLGLGSFLPCPHLKFEKQVLASSSMRSCTSGSNGMSSCMRALDQRTSEVLATGYRPKTLAEADHIILYRDVGLDFLGLGIGPLSKGLDRCEVLPMLHMTMDIGRSQHGGPAFFGVSNRSQTSQFLGVPQKC